MGTIPTITTFSAGAVLTAAQLNAVKAASDFWANTPRCSVYAGAAQTLTTSVVTALAFNSELYDIVQSGDTQSHDTVTANTKVFARTTGKYKVACSVRIVASSVGVRAVTIRLNGTTDIVSHQIPASPSPSSTDVWADKEYVLSAGDYVELYATQTSGGNLDTVAGASLTWLSIALVSA